MSTPAPRTDDELLRVYRDRGDESARAELVQRMLPLVRKIAGAYRGRGIEFEDLVQVGALGLIKAIDRFDPSRGVRLSTYAYPNISGEIKRHFRDFGWAVHMPRDLQELSSRTMRESEVLASEFGRKPTVQELASAMGASVARIEEAIGGALGYTAASLDGGDGESNPGSWLGAPDPGFEQAEARLTAGGRARRLSPRERSIVYLRFFEDRTQEEIARQVGLSQMHVSRLLRRSLERMGEPAPGERRVARRAPAREPSAARG